MIIAQRLLFHPILRETGSGADLSRRSVHVTGSRADLSRRSALARVSVQQRQRAVVFLSLSPPLLLCSGTVEWRWS